MRDQLNRPKRFGEILDTAFTLSRHRFMDFFKIFLIIVGPVFILMALFELASGTSFFREMSTGANWIDQVLNSFAEGEEMAVSAEGDFMFLLLSFVSLLLVVVAQVAILYAVDLIRRGEDFKVNKVIKQAFSKSWPLLRAYFLLVVGIFVLFFILVVAGIITFAVLAEISPVFGILFLLLFLLAIFIGLAYFGVRISLYSSTIAFGKKAFSSLGESWRLTRGRFWVLFGVFLVFMIIVGVVNSIFEFTFGLALGNSVLFGLVINAITLVTTMLTSVGVAVVYFDSHARHDSSDLKEMITDYDEQT